MTQKKTMRLLKTSRWKGLAAGLMLLPSAGVCGPIALTELIGFAGSRALPPVAPAASRWIGESRGPVARRSFNLRFAGSPQNAAAAAPSGPITFDDASSAAAAPSAQDYLARFGISIKDMTSGTKLEILNAATGLYDGKAVKAVSGEHVLTQTGSNEPIGFTLVFAAPALSVSFARAGLIAETPSGIVHPRWSARAYDAQGRVVGVAGEGQIAAYKDVPAATFRLSSPTGIVSVRFESDGEHFAAFNAVLLDDIELR